MPWADLDVRDVGPLGLLLSAQQGVLAHIDIWPSPSTHGPCPHRTFSALAHAAPSFLSLPGEARPRPGGDDGGGGRVIPDPSPSPSKFLAVPRILSSELFSQFARSSSTPHGDSFTGGSAHLGHQRGGGSGAAVDLCRGSRSGQGTHAVAG